MVQPLPPPPHGSDEICSLKYRQMLAHRLTRHVEPHAEIAKRLAVIGTQPVKQLAAALVGQGLEHSIHGDNMQPFGCLSSLVKNAMIEPKITECRRPYIDCWLWCPRP